MDRVATAGPEHTRWNDVALLVGAGIVTAFQAGKVPVALPLLQRELRLSPIEAGALLAALPVLGALAALPAGALSDRAGHRRVLVAGLALIALASAAGALASTLPWLLAGRVVEGLGFIAVVVSVPPLVNAVSAPRDRRFALGLWSAYVPLGSAVVLFGAPLAIGFGGWRAIWLLTALAAAAFAPLVLRVRDDGENARGAEGPSIAEGSPARTSIGEEVRAVFATPYPAAVGAAFAGYAAAYLALVGFLPAMLVAAGAGVGAASLAAAVVVLANAAGNLGGAVLVRVVPRWRIAAEAGAVMGACAVAVPFAALPLGVRYTAALIALLAGGTVPAALMASVPMVAPTPALVATTQGLLVQGSSIGQVLGPLAIAAAMTAGETAHAAVLAALSALTVGGALIFRRRERGTGSPR